VSFSTLYAASDPDTNCRFFVMTHGVGS